MSLDIRPVDPFDEAALTAWHRVYEESQRFSRGPHATAWTEPEIRVMMRTPPRGSRPFAFAGYARGDGAEESEQMVASGCVILGDLDNTDRATVLVDVLPAARRRGHGGALLRHLEEFVRGEGRTIAQTQTDWSPELPADGTGAEGPTFLTAHGYELALSELQRRLELPTPAGLLDRLGAVDPAYRLESFVGPIPEHLIEAYAELDAAVATEAPTGELDLEPQVPDVDRLRDIDRNLVEMGRTRYATVAFAGDGAAVAYTDLATTVHEPGRAYQWGTLVRREHRGHRLGLAVKAANLRQLQQRDPTITHVLTWNAASNEHMIAVNDLLGFVVSERAGQFRKRL